MDKLIRYTGGRILVLDIPALVFMTIALVIYLVLCYIRINKNKELLKEEKRAYFTMIITVIIFAMSISGTIGYYWCMYTML